MQNGRHERHVHSKLRDSHISGKLPWWCDAGKYFDVAALQGLASESKPMQQTRVSVGCVTVAAAKCEMRLNLTIIELSQRYRDIFDLSYCLSIENSI